MQSYSANFCVVLAPLSGVPRPAYRCLVVSVSGPDGTTGISVKVGLYGESVGWGCVVWYQVSECASECVNAVSESWAMAVR